MEKCPSCGAENMSFVYKCAKCDTPMGGHPRAIARAAAGSEVGPGVASAVAPALPVEAASLANKIAAYEYASGIFWIVVGVLQYLTCAFVIAGAWNIYAATSRFRLAKAIRALHPGVPGAFRDPGWLITMAAVNIFLGGVIGVVFVAFDAYIRSLVLKNAHIFTGSGA